MRSVCSFMVIPTNFYYLNEIYCQFFGDASSYEENLYMIVDGEKISEF